MTAAENETKHVRRTRFPPHKIIGVYEQLSCQYHNYHNNVEVTFTAKQGFASINGCLGPCLEAGAAGPVYRCATACDGSDISSAGSSDAREFAYTVTNPLSPPLPGGEFSTGGAAVNLNVLTGGRGVVQINQKNH